MKNLLPLIVIAGIFASCNTMNNGGNMTSNDNTAKNEARVQAFYDQVINAHNIAMVDSFYQPEFVDHNPDPGHSGNGIEDLKSGFKDFFAAYPDIHAKANFMISKGDTVMAYLTMTGTNSGPMMGKPGTNKQINIDGIDIIAIKDGKATERWGFFDDMKMMQQLGMMPPPGSEQKMAEEGKMGKMEGMDKMKMEGKKMDKKKK